MSLQLGDTAPNFIAKTSMGEINFYDYTGNSWAILFSHPADYTPVCTTELGQVAALKGEFEKRDIKVIGLSVDPLADHISWIKDINETQGCTIEFPIIADEEKKVSELYEFIHPKSSETATIRSLLIINPEKIVKLIILYPASTGRNFVEILRVIDSLQLTSTYKVATPANWKVGEKVFVAADVRTEDAVKEFPKGVEIIKPYLRYTPQPDMD